MKFQDMEPGVVYKVLTESSDGTFLEGDHIALMRDGGILCSGDCGGWLDKDELVPEATDFTVEPSGEYFFKEENGTQSIRKIPETPPWEKQLKAKLGTL